MFRVLLLVMLIGFAGLAGAEADKDPISGLWQHADKPALLDIQLTEGILRVHQHELHPDAEGLTVIKNISAIQETGTAWQGQMYNGYEGKYEPVTLTLMSPALLVIKDQTGKEQLRLLRPVPIAK